MRSGAAAGTADGQVRGSEAEGGEEEAVNAEAAPQVPGQRGEGTGEETAGRGLKNHTMLLTWPICRYLMSWICHVQRLLLPPAPGLIQLCFLPLPLFSPSWAALSSLASWA